MKNRFGIATAAMVAVPALLLAACGSSTSSAAPDTSPGASAPAKGQPDVNGDGKVVIGIMSPGDTNDHGYYQSFVDEANSFAADNGWKVITIDKITRRTGCARRTQPVPAVRPT